MALQNSTSHKSLNICFTKPKFMGLPVKQQHKKCASMLRLVYDLILENREHHPIFEHYNQLQEWMGSQKLDSTNLKDLADRYHEHLKAAKLSLREHNLLPNITKLDKEESSEPYPISIYLDNLRSAYNVGSILRTVEGLSLGAVCFSGKTPFIDHKQVQDSSMGACEWVRCTKEDSLDNLPSPRIVMETSPDAIPIYDFIFPESFTLIVGNEEYGCSDSTLQKADYLITIPMRGRKNSLNVANAFSMAAHEIVRQRTTPYSIKQEA